MPADAAAVAPAHDYWRSVKHGFNRLDESRVGFQQFLWQRLPASTSESLMIAFWMSGYAHANWDVKVGFDYPLQSGYAGGNPAIRR